MRIGVIGCGTAGQASALLLSRAGHQVSLLELVPSPGPVGAGLLLQPTGLAVLESMGLAASTLELGARVDRLLGTTPSGRRVLDMAYADLDPRLFGLGIQRGSLFGVLQSALEREPFTPVFGAEAATVRQTDDSVCVTDTRSRDHGPFDLLIVADGARSVIRSHMRVAARARQYPWAALWMVADDVGARFSGVLRQVYGDTRRMLGFLPAGRPRPGASESVTLFWSLPASALDACRRAGIDRWKDDVRRLTPLADALLDQADSMDRFIFAPYFDVVLRRSVHGRIVFIGDAAHATSPQLGQGANLALQDAAELAKSIGHAESPCDLPRALAAYELARQRQVAFYRFASRMLTPVFQSSLWLIAPLRDAVFEPVSRVPWVRRRMLESLAGVGDGLFSAMPLPPMPRSAPQAGTDRKRSARFSDTLCP